MKTKFLSIVITIAFNFYLSGLQAQSLILSPELKELINLSVYRARKVAEKDFDKQITQIQKEAVKSAYLPKIEIGGKYLFAYSSVNSEFGDIESFESLGKLQEFMTNPAFPVMFPNLAGLAGEITQLEQLMAQQGMSAPLISKDFDGSYYGNYYGVNATAKMLLYSGGQVPNTAKALNEKVKAQEALKDKSRSDAISEVITYYDQLALLNQSKLVLDESAKRLAAENKYASLALKNGFATSFDTLKIAVAKANLNAKIAEYESNKILLHQKLAQLSGQSANSFASAAPELELLLYADTTTDISHRAEFKALSAGLEAQKFMLKANKSHYLPKLQALASIRYDNIFNANVDMSSPISTEMKLTRMDLGPTYMIGAGFKWDIFDRSGGSSSVKKASLEVRKAENASEEARELLQLNHTKVITNYQASVSQVAYKQKQRKAARMALNLAEKSYNEGLINITERLVTETEMQSAELEYLQAVFAQRQATIECYKSTGNLTLSNIR